MDQQRVLELTQAAQEIENELPNANIRRTLQGLRELIGELIGEIEQNRASADYWEGQIKAERKRAQDNLKLATDRGNELRALKKFRTQERTAP
jgi:hypothetical protein